MIYISTKLKLEKYHVYFNTLEVTYAPTLCFMLLDGAAILYAILIAGTVCKKKSFYIKWAKTLWTYDMNKSSFIMHLCKYHYKMKCLRHLKYEMYNLYILYLAILTPR